MSADILKCTYTMSKQFSKQTDRQREIPCDQQEEGKDQAAVMIKEMPGHLQQGGACRRMEF